MRLMMALYLACNDLLARLEIWYADARPTRGGGPVKQPNERRSCGACTACCDGWLQIDVRGHQVRPGRPCPFRAEHGCSIYDERPQHPCREFVCGWLAASSPLPEWMRPDRSDMIMLAANFIWHLGMWGRQ